MPRKNITVQLNEADIKKDLERFRLVCAAETGYAFADEIKKMYRKAIALYYTDYDPLVYERTFELLKNGVKKEVRAINKTTFYAGVTPTPGRMNHKHWNGKSLSTADENALFESSFYHGSHGTSFERDYYTGKYNIFYRRGKNEVIPSNITENMIKNAIKKKRFINSAIKKGVDKAKLKNYKYLQFYSR